MKSLFRRPPDFVVGDNDTPYLRRWYLIPRNRWLNIYLHHFCRSDDDKALHDHPWWWCSVILSGGYWEHTPMGTFWRRSMRPRWGRAVNLHRIALPSRLVAEYDPNGRIKNMAPRSIPVWTVFITGPRFREWGFSCANGWKHWREFIAVGANGEQKGCGE